MSTTHRWRLFVWPMVAVLFFCAALAHPTTAAGHASPADAYIAELDRGADWPAPDPQQRAADLATGRQICDMLAHGWNEAGVVANILTWPTNHLGQQQLAAAVHVTDVWLCGQPT